MSSVLEGSKGDVVGGKRESRRKGEEKQVLLFDLAPPQSGAV